VGVRADIVPEGQCDTKWFHNLSHPMV